MSHWFADLDTEDATGLFPWQPVLDTGDGSCHAIGAWFQTELGCLEYIQRVIIGATLGEK